MSRRVFLAGIISLAIVSYAQGGINNPGTGSGGGNTGTPQTNMGLGGASLLFLNIAQTTSGGTSTQAGWPGTLNSTGYPTSSTTSSIGLNDLQFIPTYFGRYKLWWAGTGALSLTAVPIIAYSGGGALAGAGGATGSVTGNPAIGFNGASQPSSGAPLEFAFGALISAVSDGGSCAGGTAGLVCLTLSLANAFQSESTGQSVQINNVTNLAPGPWTITLLDTTHIQLQGSTFSGGMAVVGGGPGPQSEAILAEGPLTWAFPAQGFFSTNYSSMTGMVICRSQNVGTGGVSDCANIGTHYVNPDYVAVVKAANPRWVRFMDQTSVQYNFATSYANRPTTTQFSWGANTFVPAYWGGIDTNASDTYTTASNPTASPASGPPVDGEIVEGYISAANTTTVPKLAVNRTSFGSAKPILNQSAAGLSLFTGGSVPATGTIITFVFTGGGLASAFSYHYTTSTTVTGPAGNSCAPAGTGPCVDTSFDNIAANIRFDINNNTRGNSGALVTAHIISENPEASGAEMTFSYNPNINSSGVAALGNGLTITGSDSASSGTYTFGYLPIGYFTTNGTIAFTYSAISGGWIVSPPKGGTTALPGPQGGPPLEFYEDLVNLAGVGMWLTLPVLYSDASITSTAQNIAAAGVKELVLEISNETWNTAGGGQWHPINSLGSYLGWQTNFNGGTSVDDYTGLRTIQMANAARTGFTNAGVSQSKLYISLAYQFVAPSTERFSGTNITPGSNVTLAAYGGSPSNGTTTPGAYSTNSSAFPNRPRDSADFLSGAPYFVGNQFNSSFGGPINTGVALSAYNCSLVASYNYVNGNASEQTAALNFMFNGTTGDFYTTSGTLLDNNAQLGTWAHGSGNAAADYFGITSIVAADDASRTGTNPHTGLPWQLLGAAEYEGDQQAGPITTGDVSVISGNLTALGDTSGYTSGLGAQCGMTPHSGGPTSTAAADASNMQVLLLAFKNSNQFKLLYLQYFNDFKTAITSQGARIYAPGTYGFEGNVGTGGTWSKYPGTIYNTPAFQSLNAIQSFN